MASGALRAVTGKYTATGALITLAAIGFRPQRVQLAVSAGAKAGARGEWQDTMADNSLHKQTAAAVGSFVTTGGVIPLAGGFSIGVDPDLNNTGDTVHFTAFE